jgi:hypothetical protein
MACDGTLARTNRADADNKVVIDFILFSFFSEHAFQNALTKNGGASVGDASPNNDGDANIGADASGGDNPKTFGVANGGESPSGGGSNGPPQYGPDRDRPASRAPVQIHGRGQSAPEATMLAA